MEGESPSLRNHCYKDNRKRIYNQHSQLKKNFMHFIQLKTNKETKETHHQEATEEQAIVCNVLKQRPEN